MQGILQGVDNIGAQEGYFDILVMYYRMVFDEKRDVYPLYSHDVESSLYSCSKDSIYELEKKGGKIQTHKLNAVAYLWEICYDLLLAKGENVYVSLGYESLGLRVNRKRRKRDDE